MSHADWGELEIVLETQRLITESGDDLESMSALIAERIAAITGGDAVVNLLESQTLRIVAATGSLEDLVGDRRPLAGSAARSAFESHGAQLIPDIASDPRVDPSVHARLGPRSLISVPVFSREEPIAALQVFSGKDAPPLGEGERRLLELLGVVFANAYAQAAEAVARRERMTALTRFELVFSSAVMAIVVLGPDGRVLETNPALGRLLGYREEQMLGERLAGFVPAEDPPQGTEARMAMLRGETQSAEFENRLVRADGSYVHVISSMAAARGTSGEIEFFVVTLQDTTEAREAARALAEQAELNEYQALHDALTGLANRTLLADRADQAIAAARRAGESFAVMLMDLDRFKEINDTLGHAAGDAVLVKIAERMRTVVRGSDTVARLGGDEFAFLVAQVGGPLDVAGLARRIRAEVERPVLVDGLPLSVEGSVGIAFFPQDGEDTETLLRRADGAMYSAKTGGLGTAFHTGDDDVGDPHRLTLVGELRGALERGELRLHYQPKATMADASVRSVEALLRWQHPTRGLLPPADFVPLAQETGLIGPITLFVLELALTQACAWRDAGLDISVAVNLASRSLMDVGFPDQVAAVLARTGAQPDRLELEVTESTMIADPARTKAVLDRLSAMGIRLSIDDFGTGFSSLAYLRSLPVQEIKVDRSFVLGMAHDERDAAIVRSTIDLGRNLGLEVVAEGVETQAVWDRLGELGCTVAQGFLLSRPVPPGELTDWLRERGAA